MKKFVGLLAGVGLASVPAMAAAAAPSLSDVLGASGIAATGYVSGSYVDGFNDGKDIAGHTFDTSSNTFELNQAALTASYLPSEGFGALANVITGSDGKVISGSYGDDSGIFALTQAYVQWAHGGLTVIGGRFLTLSGFEVIDDSKNSNISRSLIFQNAEPLVHTGVRASYKFSDAITTYLGLSNSALSGTAVDDDKHKTVETGIVITPSSAILVAATNYYGVDDRIGSSGNTDLLDVVASFQATPALQLAVNGDYLRGVAGGGGADFYVAGVAAYVNVTFADSLKGSLRGEYLQTKNYLPLLPGGNACPKDSGKCSVEELTGTLDYTVAKNFDLLGELRYDFGNKKIYPDGTSGDEEGSKFSKSQGEILVKAIYKFGTPPAT